MKRTDERRYRRRIAALLALLLLLPISARCDSAYPQRTVTGNIVSSDREPNVRITLPRNASYVGTEKWVLFGIANCQLFAFVEANAQKAVRRLYWIQFEGYIPSMPRLHHTYDSKEHATLGGMDFFVDTWVQAGKASKADTKPLADIIKAKGYAVPAGINSGSDEQHIYALIESKGYTLPPALRSVRLVHTLDDQRKELMLIYSEAAPNRQSLTDKEQHALVSRAKKLVTIATPY